MIVRHKHAAAAAPGRLCGSMQTGPTGPLSSVCCIFIWTTNTALQYKMIGEHLVFASYSAALACMLVSAQGVQREAGCLCVYLKQ